MNKKSNFSDPRLTWMIVVFALSNTTAFVAMVQVLPVIIDSVATDFRVSRTTIAVCSTISTLVGAVAAVPIGRYVDRKGARLVMTAGSVLGTAAVLLWSQSNSIHALYISFVFIGLSIAMSTYETSFAVLTVMAQGKARSRAILSVTMIAGLSTYLVYPLLGWMNSELGWRQTLVILAVILAFTTIPGHFFAIPSSKSISGRISNLSGKTLSQALQQPDFWLMTAAFTAQLGSISAFFLLGIVFLQDAGQSPATAAAIFIAVGAAQVLSRLLVTIIEPWISVANVTVIAFALQGIGLLVLPAIASSAPLAAVAVAAAGIGQGIGVIARPILVADFYGAARFASILAVMTIPIALARAFFPLIAAWLGDWRFLILCGSAALLGAIFLGICLVISPRQDTFASE